MHIPIDIKGNKETYSSYIRSKKMGKELDHHAL